MTDLDLLAHRLAFEAAADGMLVADPTGCVVAANEALLGLLQRSAAEVIGSDWRILILRALPPEIRRRLDDDLADQREWGGRVTAARPDGSRLSIDLRVRAAAIVPSGDRGDDGSSEVGAFVVYATEVFDGGSGSSPLRVERYRDGLTGLLNRTGFLETLREHFGEAQRSGSTVSLLSIDVDKFKSLNDHLGHAYGDLLLSSFGGRLRSSLKSSDIIGRIGADEFVVLFDPGLPKFALGNVVAKLEQNLTRPYQLDDVTYSCSASFGSAEYPGDATVLEDLLEYADHAMRQAKSGGNSRYARFDRDHFRNRLDRVHLMEAIDDGIERMQFVPYYQPLFDTTTRKIVGAEALARWVDDGIVRPPAEFLPLIDGGPAGIRLGLRIFDQVMVHSRSFATLARPVSISVNLSAAQIRSEEIISHVESLAERFPAEMRRLRVELTESSFYDGDPVVEQNLRRILMVGATLSLDDFGTGHSSLLSLRAHEFSEVKIDRQFLTAVASGDAADRMLFENMLELCKNLGLQTVCEGVETEEQLAYVRAQGCDVVQGFLLGRPMSKEDFWALLRSA